jgi:HEAT repeat protein
VFLEVPDTLWPMRPIKDAIRQVFDRLERRLFGPKPTASDEDAAAMFQEIAASKDAAAIPKLLGYLLGGTEPIAVEAGRAIDRIVAETEVEKLAQLDRVVRTIREYRLPNIVPRNVRIASRGFIGALGVISMLSSGYVREEAVAALGEFDTGEELPFLLIRLNDWVGQVRKAAGAAVRRRMRPEYAPHFVRCISLVARLRFQGRASREDEMDAVFAVLSKAESRDALFDGLRAFGGSARRLSFQMLAQMEDVDLGRLLNEALSSKDPVMRLRGAHLARARLEGESLRGVLNQMKNDRFMPVRREVLHGYAERIPEKADEELRAALLDSHGSMREAARFHLRRRGFDDYGAFYRERCESEQGDRLAAAVSGLGETGTESDAGVTVRFLNHANARIRRAAVRATARLDMEGFFDVVWKALNDSSAGVTKVARQVVLGRAHVLAPERIWETFEKTRYGHSRRAILKVINDLRWWDQSALLMRALACDDEMIQQKAREYLRKGLGNPRRYSSRPTAEQVARLEQVLAMAQEIEPGVVADLRSGVAQWR